MKYIHKTLSLLSCLALILILLFTSIQAVAYWIPNYYRREYTKYHVAEDVGVSLDDLLLVTDQMMDYLDGSRENLHDIQTTIKGIPNTPFFNEKEVAHMEDVRALFLNAIVIRRVLLGFILASIAFLFITKGHVAKLLSDGFIYGTATFMTLFAILLTLIFRDFSSAFITFHHIFFDNDLWILDPAADNLIVIVPEGFFFDTAKYIGITFMGSLLLLLLLSIITKIRIQKSEKKAS